MTDRAEHETAAAPQGSPPVRARKAERRAVLLRLDPAVHEAVAKWAADELRSVNAQVEVVLRSALDRAGRSPVGAKPLRGPGRPRRPGGPDAAADLVNDANRRPATDDDHPT